MSGEKNFEKEEVIKAYALKNAAEHEGKAREASVLNALFSEGLKKEDIKRIIPKIKKIVGEVNSMKLEEQKREFEKLKNLVKKRPEREGLPELPEVPKRGIRTRISPSCSGPLHIGHVLTAAPSFLYVKRYGGVFYFRIEDTDPKNIYKPAYEMLKKEAEWLFEGKAKIIIQSERMELYYKYIEKLIKKNVAYVCVCDKDKFKDLLSKSEACSCRNLSKKENLYRWRKMLDKKGYKEGDAVVRFKADLNHPNPAMRDFPLARISEIPHPLQGRKYRVWPLMNLAVAVDDIEMKITHIIRGKDHRDNAEKQKMIFKTLGKKYPWTAFLGRIHFKDMELSTTKMRIAIEKGIYKGWDDPRLPTLESLKKQGYRREVFWELAEQIGLSEVDKNLDRKEFYLLLDNAAQKLRTKFKNNT